MNSGIKKKDCVKNVEIVLQEEVSDRRRLVIIHELIMWHITY